MIGDINGGHRNHASPTNRPLKAGVGESLGSASSCRIEWSLVLIYECKLNTRPLETLPGRWRGPSPVEGMSPRGRRYDPIRPVEPSSDRPTLQKPWEEGVRVVPPKALVEGQVGDHCPVLLTHLSRTPETPFQ